MKKTLLLLLVALFATHTLLADEISLEQALQIARQFADSPQTQQLSKRRVLRLKAEPQFAYAVKSGVSAKDNVYVVNLGNDQGFVIVSGEDGADDVVLGYCDHGSFSYDDCPVQLKDLLARYSSAIDSLRQNPKLATPRKAVKQWPDVLGSIVVGPLLTTTWNQTAPYNNLCPQATDGGMNGYDGRCPAGCVPTALAQVMNYWKWPKETIGKILVDVDSQGEFVYEDFAGHTYDWDNMLDDYGFGSSYNAVQAQAVAKLMADIGKAWQTSYSYDESPTVFARGPMMDNFGYEPGIEYGKGATAAHIQELLKAELDENRPVLYSGKPSGFEETDDPGHALVCDGYTDKDYFHFNYGWGGHCDGFYKNAMLAIYTDDVTIWMGVRPYDAQRKVINDVEYALLKNGTAEVVHYEIQNKSGITLEIPATVADDEGNEYKVTRIRQYAFMTNCNFNKVVIGENVEAIDRYAFLNSRIDELVLGDKMEMVPDAAFETTGISKLTIGANIKRIGKRAFYATDLTTVICKSPAFEADELAFSGTGEIDSGEWLRSITKLGYRAFAGKTFTKNPAFDKLTEIKDEVFNGCSFNKGFSLPSKMRMMSPNAFNKTLFYGFDPNDVNPYYESTLMGLLYNKNQTSLALAPLANMTIESWMMPETLMKLEPGSVMSRRSQGGGKYYGFEIPGTVVEMEGAFSNCETLGKLKCLAVVPPIITDETFNDKIFTNTPNITLYVPVGTAELYRNAPGWRRFPNIVDDQEYNPAPAQARQYYMVIQGTDENRQHVSIPVEEVLSMSIDESTGNLVVKRSGKEDLVTDIKHVDQITWMPGFVYENAEVFDLNEENLTAEAQKCSVKFDPTVIDEDIQLCIRNAVLMPDAPENMVDGFAIDLSLSNGQHELDGTVEITVPFSASDDERVGAAYYNETTGEWEPVYYNYDRNTGKVTIITNHLSVYTVYKVLNKYSTLAMMDPAVQVEYLIEGSRDLKDLLVKLIRIVQSEYPKVEMINQYKDEMSLWQSIGLDGIWSILRGVGEATVDFRPEKLDKIVEGFGYFGLALNILDVARCEANDDDIGVAAGSLKTILSYSSGQLAAAIGTPIMTVSMGMVAFIGIALDKFGTTVADRKHDLFNAIYRYFYSRRGRNDPDVRSCYRSAKDWYKILYPVIAGGNMTDAEWNEYVKSEVEDYCNQLWSDKYNNAYESCYWICKTQFPSTSFAWPEESMKKQLAQEHFAELMNGELVSVVNAIKRNLAVEGHNRYVKAFKDIANMVNTKIALRIVDSSWKEGEKSKYAGWKIGFSEIPSELEDDDKLKLKKALNERGRVGIGWITEYCILSHEIPTQLTLYDPDDKPQKTYNFQIPDGEGKVIIDLDLATGGVEVEAPMLKDLGLNYSPACAWIPWRKTGTTYYYDSNGDIASKPYESDYGTWDPDYQDMASDVNVPLNPQTNYYYRNIRFQTELEKFFKQHDFITVDQTGNFKIGNDIIGTFNGNEATGTFTINTTYSFVEKTKEEAALWLREFNALDPDSEKWIHEVFKVQCPLMNGTMQHKIECKFTIVRNGNGTYTVTYTGEGTYKLNAETFDTVSGFKWLSWVSGELFNSSKISADNIWTKNSTAEGKVTLNYKTTLRE